MKTLTIGFIITIALGLSACGWSPSVKPVQITEPWASMGLPVKENAVVWASTDKQFKAAHKEDKKTIMTKYVDALKAKGWQIEKLDDKSGNIIWIDMAKGSEKIQIQVYDFENTGVIIDKQ